MVMNRREAIAAAIGAIFVPSVAPAKSVMMGPVTGAVDCGRVTVWNNYTFLFTPKNSTPSQLETLRRIVDGCRTDSNNRRLRS